MNISSIFDKSGLDLSTGDSSIYITSLGANVERKYLNDSYSYGNVFSFDIEGAVYQAYTAENLQTGLYKKIESIANSGKYNFRVKSLNFPNSLAENSEGIRFLKFNATVEFNEKIISGYENFREYSASSQADTDNFLISGISGLENYGDLVKDYSENFNFDESENGECKFTHSVNLGLLPETGSGIFDVIKNGNLRKVAAELISGSVSYNRFQNLAKLFTGNGFVFNNSSWIDHFSGNFTHSETVDLFANSYSLTRSRTYYTGYNADYFFNHSYDLSIGGDGTIEISENTEMKGSKSFTDLTGKFYSDIESASSAVFNGDSNFNTTKSYDRCKKFLQDYRYFLRKTKSETDASSYLSHYTNSTSLYSLRPIAIERSFSSIPEFPALTYNVKYSTNPNLQYGYESKSNVKVTREGAIVNATHSFEIKSINFKTGDFNNFNTSLGTSTNAIINFNDFTTKSIDKSVILIHDLMNGGQDISLKNLKPDPSTQIPLALIKKSSKIPRRGNDFSLTLEYSSDNKYAPLYFKQNPYSLTVNAPNKSQMFTNLLIPNTNGLHQYLSDKFSFFDKKVTVTVPVEKFTERIVLGRPQGVSIIDPSVNSSTGKMKITFNGKINKYQDGDWLDRFFSNQAGSGGAQGGTMVPFLNKILDLRNNFFGTSALFAPIFHATVTSEIGKLIDDSGAVHPINGYAPISLKYSFGSNFDFTIEAEVEFYSKSVASKRKPIFGFKGNKTYNGNINTKSIFNQIDSF
jgi:hypothetical protein